MTAGPASFISIALFLVSLNTLMLEILLIRVFDTILLPNVGYMVITCAMFGLGLAGIHTAIYPSPPGEDARRRIGVLILLFAGSVLLLRPLVNLTQPAYLLVPPGLLRYAVGGTILYLGIVTPFFLSGLIFSYLFAAYPSRINALYFWDLAGAAVGCVVYLPFIREFGPGGLMIVGAGTLSIAAALLLRGRAGSRVLWIPASALLVLPLMRSDGYYDFNEIENKRGVVSAREAGLIERSEWDPISKIYVVDVPLRDDGGAQSRRQKHIMYDGGSQSSYFQQFNGDYAQLRETVLRGGNVAGLFWHRGVLASHYLRRDGGSKVLVIGSAGGQETKAALVFGAAHVDGIELVEAVVDLGKGPYSDFIGGLFHDPRVEIRVGEGRSYLRGTQDKYDIIQIFSNHTSSNIATGIGATTPVYLQTVEAYLEFFTHLTEDGILHVNHHFYPRMVTTAAEAWRRLGRRDFQSHVAVFERRDMDDTLPTFLVKLTPWTRSELDELHAFLALDEPDSPFVELVVDPVDPDASFLSPPFFSGDLPDDLREGVAYRVWAPTDDRPYFGTIQRTLERVEVDPTRFLNRSMVAALNGRLGWFAGEYTVFVVVGAAGLLCSLALVLLPLLFSPVGRIGWHGKYMWVGYFACLGAAFIIVELVLVQLFMKPIGFPLYTFAVVLFSLLLAAGVGSFAGNRLGVHPEGRWWIPFLGILVTGGLFLLSYRGVFEALLALPLGGRILGSALMILPMGFFMGMPFPLGILALQHQPQGAIAWAWGMNALFTVIGGVVCGVLSLELGFRMTLLSGLAVYVGALLLVSRLLAPGAAGPASGSATAT